MAKIEKVYKIEYILSNGKPIIHHNKRGKTIKEWEMLSDFSYEEVIKYLKLNKGKNKEKYKDVNLVKVGLYDWVGNLMVSRLFDVSKKKEDNNEKEL